MTKPATTSQDYAAILQRVPVQFRQKTFETMLRGTTNSQTGQPMPGLEEQFITAEADCDSYALMVHTRARVVAQMEEDDRTPKDLLEKAQNDLATMHYYLAVKQEGVAGLAHELARIQKLLDEITTAGTSG